jgi:hypothetical protein
MASRTFDVNAEPVGSGTGDPDAADRFGQLPGLLAVNGPKANSHSET